MGKQNKKPKQKAVVLLNPKTPRITSTGTNHLSPVWKFSIFDAEGPWGVERLARGKVLEEILEKLRNFESQTWAQIEQAEKQHHSVLTQILIKKANDRLEVLQLDDVEELFRFRLTGKQRIWGIRDRNIFKILWWDDDHEICPSQLRNT